MPETEYIRSLHSNYERICLHEKPEENQYQYCILSRGGIRGLLPCDLRYVNGLAYLYYDISSRQTIAQLYQKEPLNRIWVLDFLYSLRQLRNELSRFLLRENAVVWDPEQIFQDLEQNSFSFLYIPYYEEENSFLKVLSFLVEHIDYTDESLVDCVYAMYEQLDKNGEIYLQEKIFEDMKKLEESPRTVEKGNKQPRTQINAEDSTVKQSAPEVLTESPQIVNTDEKSPIPPYTPIPQQRTTAKRGFLSHFDLKKGKSKEEEREENAFLPTSYHEYAVAEEFCYNEDRGGQTVFLDSAQLEVKPLHRIYSTEGIPLSEIGEDALLIGKNKGKVDLHLEDASVSRLHARIIRVGDKEEVFLEDLNSTNGTQINGSKLKPYERRELHSGDEIMFGKTRVFYR